LQRGTDPQSSVDAEGGYTIPQGFSNELYVEMAQWGGMLQAGRMFNTSTGNPIDWPTVDDTAATSTLIAENAAVAVQDMDFGNKTLNAYNYTSGIVKVPVTLLQDSAFDLPGFLREAFARRLGVGINAAFNLC
jgi:HK97 family phage major capsid protein